MSRHTKYIYTVSDYKGNVVAEGTAKEVAEMLGYTRDYLSHIFTKGKAQLNEGKFKVSRKEI